MFIESIGNMEKFSPEDLSDEHIFARYWLVLVRRWWVVGITFVAMFIGGLVYANTRPSLPFPHMTTIEIGRFADGSPLEGMRVVAGKIQESYIPFALNVHANANGYDQIRYSIKVDIPEEGNTVLLKSYGSPSDTRILLGLQQAVADLLINDHENKTELIKNDLIQQKFKAELALEDIQARAQLFPSKRKLIEETASLLKRQIETVANLINTAEKDRTSALASALEKGSVDQSLTTTILLMNTTIAENRERLRGLEERYYITLQKERADIDTEERENKRQEKEQEQLIKDAEFRRNNLQETRVIIPSSRQLRESPKSSSQIVGLFGIMGIFLGIFAAGFAEFSSNARKYGKLVGRN